MSDPYSTPEGVGRKLQNFNVPFNKIVSAPQLVAEVSGAVPMDVLLGNAEEEDGSSAMDLDEDDDGPTSRPAASHPRPRGDEDAPPAKVPRLPGA